MRLRLPLGAPRSPRHVRELRLAEELPILAAGRALKERVRHHEHIDRQLALLALPQAAAQRDALLLCAGVERLNVVSCEWARRGDRGMCWRSLG